MKHRLPYLAVAVVLLYALYNATLKEPTSKRATPQHPHNHLTLPKPLPSHVNDTYSYMIDVIEHGSSRLHFKPQEVMEGGFASSEDAPKIACYLMALRKESCPTPALAQEGALYFSSNCAGCHGNDAKGIHGTYPDLTRKPLLGIESIR